MQRFFHLHTTWKGGARPDCRAPSARQSFAMRLHSTTQAPGLCQGPTSASFCARSTISVTASTQLCSSRERRAPRVKLLSMTKRFPVACRQGAQASLGQAGGCCAWPVLPQQQQCMRSSAGLWPHLLEHGPVAVAHGRVVQVLNERQRQHHGFHRLLQARVHAIAAHLHSGGGAGSFPSATRGAALASSRAYAATSVRLSRRGVVSKVTHRLGQLLHVLGQLLALLNVNVHKNAEKGPRISERTSACSPGQTSAAKYKPCRVQWTGPTPCPCAPPAGFQH